MFSVIIPLFNKEGSIYNTIQSVLNQNFTAFELIVINDGSTDSSLKAVQHFNDQRIRVISQENRGVSTARNVGIKEARHEWISFLDGDDLWKPNHLATVQKMIKMYPKEKVFATSFEYSDGRFTTSQQRNQSTFLIDDYFKEATKEHLLCTIVLVAKRGCFEISGNFNEKLTRGEDIDMWNRLAKNFPIVKTEIITAIYRTDAENRACTRKASLEQSVISEFDLRSIFGSERAYYKNLIILKIKSLIVEGNFTAAFALLKKHHLRLLRS